MPANKKKTRCTCTTAQGQPCRAWAVRGTRPPICSAHAGLTVGAGAPKGNQNARTHGFYAPALSAQEKADLASYTSDLSLQAEIACARVALRRVLEYICQGRAELGPGEIMRVLGLIFHGARTVSRLVRDQDNLSSGPASEYAALMNELLDQLSEEWGVEL